MSTTNNVRCCSSYKSNSNEQIANQDHLDWDQLAELIEMYVPDMDSDEEFDASELERIDDFDTYNLLPSGDSSLNEDAAYCSFCTKPVNTMIGLASPTRMKRSNSSIQIAVLMTRVSNSEIDVDILHACALYDEHKLFYRFSNYLCQEYSISMDSELLSYLLHHYNEQNIDIPNTIDELFNLHTLFKKCSNMSNINTYAILMAVLLQHSALEASNKSSPDSFHLHSILTNFNISYNPQITAFVHHLQRINLHASNNTIAPQNPEPHSKLNAQDSNAKQPTQSMDLLLLNAAQQLSRFKQSYISKSQLRESLQTLTPNITIQHHLQHYITKM